MDNNSKEKNKSLRRAMTAEKLTEMLREIDVSAAVESNGEFTAMAGISERSGSHSSRSQRLTVLSETKSLSARSFCVIPFALRKTAINLPIVFFSITYLRKV